MKINYDEMTVEDGGVLYKMKDLARLSAVYGRLCTMEYIFDDRESLFDTFGIEIANKEQAYILADEVRNRMLDYDDFETRALEEVLYWHSEKRGN